MSGTLSSWSADSDENSWVCSGNSGTSCIQVQSCLLGGLLRSVEEKIKGGVTEKTNNFIPNYPFLRYIKKIRRLLKSVQSPSSCRSVPRSLQQADPLQPQPWWVSIPAAQKAKCQEEHGEGTELPQISFQRLMK